MWEAIKRFLWPRGGVGTVFKNLLRGCGFNGGRRKK